MSNTVKGDPMPDPAPGERLTVYVCPECGRQVDVEDHTRPRSGQTWHCAHGMTDPSPDPVPVPVTPIAPVVERRLRGQG